MNLRIEALPIVPISRDVHGRRRDDVTSVAADIDVPRKLACAVLDVAKGGFEVEVPTPATGPNGHSLRDWRKTAFEFCQAGQPFFPGANVDVNYDDPGYCPGRNPNIGIRFYRPPISDSFGVCRGRSEATSESWVFSGRVAFGDTAITESVCNSINGEHCHSAGGIFKRMVKHPHRATPTKLRAVGVSFCESHVSSASLR